MDDFSFLCRAELHNRHSKSDLSLWERSNSPPYISHLFFRPLEFPVLSSHQNLRSNNSAVGLVCSRNSNGSRTLDKVGAAFFCFFYGGLSCFQLGGSRFKASQIISSPIDILLWPQIRLWYGIWVGQRLEEFMWWCRRCQYKRLQNSFVPILSAGSRWH